jgi:hypothetical protein
MLPAICLPFFISRVQTRWILIASAVFCCIGQGYFAHGLQTKNQSTCILGRAMIGFSDLQFILQQTIMCTWFPTSQLPFAYGIMLFLVKIVRTTNDNVASLYYNATNGGLVSYMWVGFAVSIFSLVCSVILAQIHESVIE